MKALSYRHACAGLCVGLVALLMCAAGAVLGADTTLQEARQAFLAARVTNSGGNTYAKASEALRAAAKSDPTAAVKLECLLMSALGLFLDGRVAAAAQDTSAALPLLRAKFADRPGVKALDRVPSAVKADHAKAPDSVGRVLQLGEDGTALIDALCRLHRRRQRVEAKCDARWRKHQELLNREVETWTRREHIPAADAARARLELERKFKPRGYITRAEIEDALIKLSLELLFTE